MASVWRAALLGLVCLFSGARASAAPTVSIGPPANGATFTAPANIAITANIITSKNTTLTRVDYYSASTLIGTVNGGGATCTSSCAFVYSWSSVGYGTYALTAKATDSAGNVGTSSVVNITVNRTPPTVNLVTPSSGALFPAPGTIGLSASASAASGASISKVEFLNGTTVLYTATTPPYSYTWSNVPAGIYTLSARATDNFSTQATSTPITATTGAGNAPPLVALTLPMDCGPFDTTTGVPLSADAVDPDGYVQRVEFYQGSTLIGTLANPNQYADLRNAYQMTWSGMPGGTYTISAKAYDNRGAVTTSAPVTVTIGTPNQPPTVSLSAPAPGATYSAGSSIVVGATASDTDDTIARVDFYAGATLIGSSTSAPYSVVWSGAAIGNYSLTAVATDSRGASTTSAAVLVTVVASPVTVNVSGVTAGTTYYTPAAVAMSATATSTAGTIAQVQFFQGTTLLGTATASPYSYIWSAMAPGTYSITAKATDSAGNVGTSPAIGITVASPVVTYLHDDLLGSPIAATDPAGNVLWRETYEPYGKRIVNAPAASGNRQFYTGKPLDAETGFGYYGARYYDPVIGRFLGVDSVDFTEVNLHSFNRFNYANNNPYKFVDPDGRFGALALPIAIGLGIGAIIVASQPQEARVQWLQRLSKAIGNALHSEGAENTTVKPEAAGAGSEDGAGKPREGETGGPGAGKAFGEKTKDKIRDRDGNKCVFCKKDTLREPGPDQSQIDHAQPKSRGGNNSENNGQNTCRDCNGPGGKGAKTTEEYLRGVGRWPGQYGGN